MLSFDPKGVPNGRFPGKAADVLLVRSSLARPGREGRTLSFDASGRGCSCTPRERKGPGAVPAGAYVRVLADGPYPQFGLVCGLQRVTGAGLLLPWVMTTGITTAGTMARIPRVIPVPLPR